MESEPLQLPRRPGRPPKLTTDAVGDELNEMVDQLIAENRQLRRQLAQLLEATSAPDHGAETTLRKLLRKVERAVVS